MTIGQVADMLGVSVWRIRYLHESGKMPEPPRHGIKRDYGPDEVARLVAYFMALQGLGQPKANKEGE